MKQRLNTLIQGGLIFACICGVAGGGIEEFTFHEVDILVTDSVGNPIQGASVRLYSQDWLAVYPQQDFAKTDLQGLCSLRVPRGRWAAVVGGGQTFNAPQSGQALFLYSEVEIENDDLIAVHPDYATSLLFSDRLGRIADVDAIYAAPTAMVPSCRMPDIGTTQGGQCSLLTNLSEDISLFFVRRPTTQQEGYYIFEENLRTNKEIAITADSPSLKHVPIVIDPNGVGEITGVTWHLCFPYQDLERTNTFSSFRLEDLDVDVYTNIDYLNYTLFLRVGDTSGLGDVQYWFQYRGVDLSEGSSHPITVGGPITRQFRFADRSVFAHVNHTQFMLGPITDAYGNEIRYYNPAYADAPCSTFHLTIYNRRGGAIIYDADFELCSTGLAFMIDRAFPETAAFRLEWDMGSYWQGATHVEGLLYDDEHLYAYEDTITEHFDLHTPVHGLRKASALASRLEQVYSAMVELLGDEPTMLPGGRHFYVNPVGHWAGSEGQELGYAGYREWYPGDPASRGWTRMTYHEIGHRVAAEMYHPQYTLSGRFGEATANTLADYVLEQLHGKAFATPHRRSVAHSFLRQLENGVLNPSNSHFIMGVYLPQKYGMVIHKQFYRNWIAAYTILKPRGFEQMEIYTALYSLLADENLTWLFNLCGLRLQSGRINDAVAEIASLKPATPDAGI